MNDLLKQALALVEKQVTDRARFDRLVKAGTTAIYDKGVFDQLTAKLESSQDPVTEIARGIVGVVNVLRAKARGTIPDQTVLIQAGMALLLDALAFAEEAGLIKADKQALEAATIAFFEAMSPALGKPAERLDAELSEVGGVISSRMNELMAAAGGK